MCAEYSVNTDDKEIQNALDQAVKNMTAKKHWDARIKLTNNAPAVKIGEKGLELVERIFPVSPFPNARLSGVERDDEKVSDEDQIRRIYHLPTWKKGFIESPLLIPMTSFLEPVYWGKDKGSVMEFKIPKEDLFFAAAIEIKPRTPKSLKTDGFALITHTATDQMLKYHHRLAVVFEAKKALGYLEANDAEERFEYILKNRVVKSLIAEPSRQMAKGWEKRVEIQEKKLEREKRYTETLKKEVVEG